MTRSSQLNVHPARVVFLVTLCFAFLAASGSVGVTQAVAQEAASIDYDVIGKKPRSKSRPGQQPNTVTSASNARLYGTLWMQKSLEYTMATMQLYQAAQQILPALVSDQSQYACLEQSRTGSRMVAIILDVDETVLNNSPFQARLVDTGSDYTTESWEQWVSEASAEAIPGAAEFIHFARRRVEVFFVTNRTANLETATVDNLSRALGYQVDPANLLMKGEQPDWTSDKSSRRSFVAQQYRVVMLFGDDFNDFVSLGKLNSVDRQLIGLRHSQRFGRQWILMPNPLYGSWERSLHVDQDELTFEDKLKAKRAALKLQ